jgi:cytidylate kinase
VQDGHIFGSFPVSNVPEACRQCKEARPVEQAIMKRDELDKNKKEGSLKIAEDATYIDTSDLTIDNVCEIILSKIHI